MALKFSDYDQRNYPTVDAREGYALWSENYDQGMSGELDLRLLERLETVSWASHETVADLACGTGRIGSWLAERGVPTIDGVDLVPEMLQRAREKGIYRQLIEQDMRQTGLPDNGYDLVINVLSNEHLPQLGPFYREAERLLRDGGRFVLLGYHPHFMLNGIPTHFRRADGCNQAIEAYIHLFSDHVAAARARDLWLLEMRENIVDERWIARHPNWEKHRGRPASFALVWGRRP